MKPLFLKNHSVLLKKCAIIKDIALELEEAEILVLLGPNGSGKSTLLHSLMGTLDSRELSLESDQSFLMGEKLSHFNLQKRSSLLTAVFQRPEIYSQLSVRKYFEFSQPGQKLNQPLFEEIVSLLKIKNFIHRDLGTLSGGEFKKVAIGAALSQETKVVLLDEPFQALDPESKEVVGQTIHHFQKERKVSFVIAAHDFYWAKKLANKFLFLKRGESVAYGISEDVFTKETLQLTFGINFKEFQSEEGESFLYPGGL